MKSVIWNFVLSFFFAALSFGQWEQTSGPEGGAVFSIFNDGSNLYLGLAAAGVFRSTDEGATWSQKISGMGYQSTTVINKSGNYLLASGTVGLYRSTDIGESWTASTGLPTANGVSSLAVDGANVIAGTSGKGVYVSTDNGETWTSASSGLPGNGTTTYVGCVLINGTVVLASATDNNTQTTMYRSTNLGASWSPASSGLPADFSMYNVLHLDGSVIYAGGSFLYKTTNNGDSWTQSENGIPNYSGISAIAANGSLVLAGAYNHLYRSTNGGALWEKVSGGFPLMTCVSVKYIGTSVYAGTIANGVYKSTNAGGTWTQIVNGLKARDMSSFYVDGTTLYGNGNSIFRTTDEGSIWTNVRGNMKDSVSQPSLVFVNGSTMFASDFLAAGLYRSVDGGLTWAQVGSGLSQFGAVQTIVASGSALLTASSGRVHKSTDNGDTWFQTDNSITQFVNFGLVTKIGNVVYAHGTNVYRSTDEGVTWIDSDEGMPAFFQVDAIASNGNYLFAGGQYSSTYYRSSNNGDSWEARPALPSNGNVNQFFGLGSNIFACSPNNGIFLSTNDGGSWTKISTGLPNTNYRYSLAIHNSWLLAGTSGNAVWRRPLSQVTDVSEAIVLTPNVFTLNQNYPNPFNPSTKISWQSPLGSHQTLKVYDVLGNEVAILVDEYREPGRYEVEFDARELSSGVYFYRLEAGEFISVKKLVLMR